MVVVTSTLDDPCQEHNILKRGKAPTKFIKKDAPTGSPTTLLPLCQWKARAQPFLHQVTLLRPLSHLDHRGIKHAQIDG
jgi:hypothetical protein